MSDKLTLGSLFDGSGGFPLAGTMCGIQPRWAAEVEPYPIAVTKSRFPNMKHLGDITKVNGAEIEPVDIITFGSPCQDLSVAGKRAGLKHEANGDDETTRSGLFMEAVRIVKEMREETNGLYPTFVVWENVHGAFSSNNGEDFRIVLEEIIKIVEPTATMPQVPKGGWAYADSYVGDGWSLAYRVFDAQYWGVPQRRRRIYLVADFRGERARKVLFEREGLRGYFATGRTPWQTTPADAQGGAVADDREGEGFDGYNGDLTGGVTSTLGVNCGLSSGRSGVIERRRQLDAVGVINAIGGNAENGQETDTFPTLTNGTAPDFGNAVAVPYTMQDRAGKPVICLQGNGIDRADTAGCNGKGWNDEACYTLNTIDRPAVVYAIDQGGGKSGANVSEDTAPTLCTTHGGEPAVAYGLDRASFNQGQNAQFDFSITEEQQPTLTARGPGAVCCTTLMARDWKDPTCVAYPTELHDFLADHNADAIHQQDQIQAADGVSRPLVAATHGAASHHTKTVIYDPPNYIVRRLTPTECARLQGFADWWGYLEAVDTFGQKEYQFWMEVRNTHAAINGKKVQEYTVKQMLTWYNKLWTDSSEYKMWGNGIALPCALYVMQGIEDALMVEDCV